MRVPSIAFPTENMLRKIAQPIRLLRRETLAPALAGRSGRIDGDCGRSVSRSRCSDHARVCCYCRVTCDGFERVQC